MTLRQTLSHDLAAALARDPAARSKAEVIFAYPGFHAILTYRLAHRAWARGWKLAARLLTHIGRMLTGIEIHPAAQIGCGFFVDHGMGVVIGETTQIGDDVTLYQGVTLGGTSLEGGKRHPTLGNGVIVGAGAKVLGPISIGEMARIGSNAVVVKDVGAHATMVGVPAKPARPKTATDDEFCAYGTPAGDLPDPVSRALDGLLDQVHRLSARVGQLEDEIADCREPELTGGSDDDNVRCGEGQ